MLCVNCMHTGETCDITTFSRASDIGCGASPAGISGSRHARPAHGQTLTGRDTPPPGSGPRCRA